jgi:hypothetical protein
MTEQWLSLDAAVKLIRSDRKVSVGGAVQFLIDACAGGVRARQRPCYEEHGWGLVIPAAVWRGAHLDLDTGELFPAGTDQFDPPTEYGGYGDGGSGIIEVAEDDLRDYLRKLAEEAHEHEEVRGAAAWIAVAARQMKKDGKIPQNIKITDFAKELERRMKAAAAVERSLRGVKWGYIKNKLPEWGLWPVSSIR